MPKQEIFFERLGKRIRDLRKARGYSQEQMGDFGFAIRHWQRIEAGTPVNVTTLLRICEIVGVQLESLVSGLDKGIYERPARQ